MEKAWKGLGRFTHLPLEVIIENIFPNLNLMELCTVRCASQAFNYRVGLYLSRLKKLDMFEVKDLIDELGLRNIVYHLSLLEEICLDGCWRAATKTNLLALFKNCPSLTHFSAKRCKCIDDEILADMSRHCVNLEVVNVRCCFQITSAGVIELFKCCKKLYEFTVAGNYGFTDEAVKYIGYNCDSIKELDFGSCFYVTDNGVEHLLNGRCKDLAYVRTKGCSKISEEMTRKMVQKGIVVNNCF